MHSLVGTKGLHDFFGNDRGFVGYSTVSYMKPHQVRYNLNKMIAGEN